MTQTTGLLNPHQSNRPLNLCRVIFHFVLLMCLKKASRTLTTSWLTQYCRSTRLLCTIFATNTGESWGKTECPLLTVLSECKLLLIFFSDRDLKKKHICQMSNYVSSTRSCVQLVKISSAQQLQMGLSPG